MATPASYEHEGIKPLLLVPGGYLYFSRLRRFRDLAVNTIQWIVPSFIVSLALGGHDLATDALAWVLGFFLFVSVYEVGYLANDSYGLRGDPTPRARVKIRFDKPFVALFLATRIAAWIAILSFLPLWQSAAFVAAYAGLAAALVLHNVLKPVQFKFFTFLQLSLFRFSLPGLPIFVASARLEPFAVLVLTGLFLFTFPRVITYFDAKGRLDLEERKETRFLLVGTALTLPFILALSALAASPAPLLGWSWAIAAQLTFVTASRYRSFR